MKKNVASQSVGAQMVSASDGTAFTGSVTVYVTGDAGTQAVGSVGSGACTHEGNGYHTYAPAQAETNYDLVAFTFIGTGAIPATVQVYTSFPQTGDSFARLGAPAGASVSADVAAVKSDTAAILLDTGTDGVVVAAGSKTGYSLTATTGLGNQTANITGNLSGSVGSVTGAVGSVSTGGITAASFGAGAVDAAALAADAGTEIATAVWASGTRVLTSNTNLNDPSAAAIADAVWDEALSGHLTAGTGGAALNDADVRGDRVVVRATVDSASTTTSIVTSAFSPSGVAADQFKGRIVVFDNDTTTTSLRGQATSITASSAAATPTLTVVALTTAPASGDTFSVL